MKIFALIFLILQWVLVFHRFTPIQGQPGQGIGAGIPAWALAFFVMLHVIGPQKKIPAWIYNPIGIQADLTPICVNMLYNIIVSKIHNQINVGIKKYSKLEIDI